MDSKDVEILSMNGWELECESPFEIRHRETGSFATGIAAEIVLSVLKEQEY